MTTGAAATTGAEPGTGRGLVVAAVLVDHLEAPTAVLAGRRSHPTGLAGRWEFPGGKAGPGEPPVDALRRELREELGCDVRLGDELVGPDAGRWPVSDRLVMRIWLAEPVWPPRPGGSHDALRWLTPATWDDVPWLAADLAALPAVAGRLALRGRRG